MLEHPVDTYFKTLSQRLFEVTEENNEEAGQNNQYPDRVSNTGLT